jgi:hypothetical protein
MMEIALFGGPDDGAVISVKHGTQWISPETQDYSQGYKIHGIYIYADKNRKDSKGRAVFESRPHL